MVCISLICDNPAWQVLESPFPRIDFPSFLSSQPRSQYKTLYESKYISRHIMYRFAHAFPGAVFTIPCDGPLAYNPVDTAATPSDAVLESHFNYLLSPVQSPSTIASADIGRMYCSPGSSTSTYAWSTSSWYASTAEDNSAHVSDPVSSSPERLTWGRPPRASDLGPMVDVVSPWGIEDARRVFGKRLRFGNRIRPNTPRPDTPITLDGSQHAPSSSPTTTSERASSPIQERTAAPSTPSGESRMRAEFVDQALVVRPDGVYSERVVGIIRANALRIQTQDISGYYHMSTLLK